MLLGQLNYVLLLHLAGAAGTLLLAVATVWQVSRSQSGFGRGALALAALGLFQIATGAWLAATAGTSATAFCQRGGLYLAAIAAVELWLYAKAPRPVKPFPARLVLASFAGSIAIIGVALVRL